MINLFLFFLAGFAIRLISEWVISRADFNYRKWIPSTILSVCLGLLLSYFFKDAKGNLFYFCFAASGFFSMYFFTLIHRIQNIENKDK